MREKILHPIFICTIPNEVDDPVIKIRELEKRVSIAELVLCADAKPAL